MASKVLLNCLLQVGFAVGVRSGKIDICYIKFTS